MLKFKERIQLIKELERTRKEYLKKHRDMWNWIADNILFDRRIVTKLNYLKYIGVSEYDDKCPRNNCYCCELDKKFNMIIKPHYEDYYQCKYCPLRWHGKYPIQCEDSNSQYKKYKLWTHYSYDNLPVSKAKIISDLARSVANVSERKLVFWIQYAMILLGVQIVWM